MERISIVALPKPWVRAITQQSVHNPIIRVTGVPVNPDFTVAARCMRTAFRPSTVRTRSSVPLKSILDLVKPALNAQQAMLAYLSNVGQKQHTALATRLLIAPWRTTAIKNCAGLN